MCECAKIICLRCKLSGHEPLDCGMMEDWKENLDKVMDHLNLEWKKKNTKKCPHCKVDIQKNEGCMHMTCRHCHHEFCWMCLGDWSKHGSQTGGFYQCNLYKKGIDDADDEEKMKEELIKRLQFFTDRYFEQKRSVDLTETKLKEIEKMLYEDEECDVSRFSKEHNDEMEFYLEAYSYLYLCRNFVLHTYPLSYRIIDAEANLLFTQTQSMLTHSLETFNKFLVENPIESFIKKVDGNIYHSDTFAGKKAELVDLHNSLNLQFKGAQFSFTNKEFRDKVRQMFSKAKNSKIGWYERKIEDMEGDVPAGPPENWYCTQCTFWNHGNQQAVCTMCGLQGRPDN